MTSSRQTYDDGRSRRSRGWRSSSGSSFKTPRFVMANSEEEVERFCQSNHVGRDKMTWLQTVDQLRVYPDTQRMRVQRTGTWWMMNPDDLSEIEEELKFRKEYIDS